jgi:hypothetical protein
MQFSMSEAGNCMRRFTASDFVSSKNTYLESIDKLAVADVAVLVQVESVENNAEFLRCEENAHLARELLEFDFVEHAISIDVE